MRRSPEDKPYIDDTAYIAFMLGVPYACILFLALFYAITRPW